MNQLDFLHFEVVHLRRPPTDEFTGPCNRIMGEPVDGNAQYNSAVGFKEVYLDVIFTNPGKELAQLVVQVSTSLLAIHRTSEANKTSFKQLISLTHFNNSFAHSYCLLSRELPKLKLSFEIKDNFPR